SRGKPWDRNSLRGRVRRLRQKLNLDPGAVAYTFRHSFAATGLEQGVPVATPAELLGHSSTDVANEHSAHLDQRAAPLREAACRRTADPDGVIAPLANAFAGAAFAIACDRLVVALGVRERALREAGPEGVRARVRARLVQPAVRNGPRVKTPWAASGCTSGTT